MKKFCYSAIAVTLRGCELSGNRRASCYRGAGFSGQVSAEQRDDRNNKRGIRYTIYWSRKISRGTGD